MELVEALINLDKLQDKLDAEALDEAKMSDEDREDTMKLRGLAQKVKYMDGRANPRKQYTDDEIEIAKKYNLYIPQKRGDYLAVMDNDTMGNLTNRLSRVPAKKWDVRNDADFVRKNKERSTEEDGWSKNRRYSHQQHGDWGGESALEQDRARDARNMSRNVDNMKSALWDRNYHKDKLQKADTDFQKAIFKAMQNRDSEREYHSNAGKDSQRRIDNILADVKKRKTESLRQINKILHRLNEAPMSDEDREDTKKLRSLAGKISNMDYRKAPRKYYTQDDLDIAQKYNLELPQGRDDRRDIIDKDTKLGVTSYINKGWGNDKRNVADAVRKNKARSIEGSRIFIEPDGPKLRRYDHYPHKRFSWQNTKSAIEQDRELDAITMSKPVRDMKDALYNRKYAQQRLDNADKEYDDRVKKAMDNAQKEISNAASSRDWDKEHYSGHVKYYQSHVDDILANAKNRKKTESLTESDDNYSKWILVDYFDVLGNAEDGWEVNNLARDPDGIGEIVISDDMSDKEIFEYLRDKVNYFNKSLKFEDVEIMDDGDFIEFEASADGMPICRLERVG